MRKIGPFILSSLISLLGLVSPASLFGQVPTYTIPQTVQQSLTGHGVPNTPDSCLGATTEQTYTVKNLGQTQHYVNIQLSAPGGGFPPHPAPFVGQARVQIVGLDQNNNATLISDVMEPGPNGTGVTPFELQGTGYYPIIEIQVECSVGAGNTFLLTYSGTSATPNVDVSAYQLAQLDKVPFTTASATTTATDNLLITPFANSAGTLIFTGASAVTGSSVTLTCTGAFTTIDTQAPIVVSPTNSTSPQFFPVSAGPCPLVTIAYAPGSGGTTFTLEYIFTQPGMLASSGGGGGNVNIAQYGGVNTSLGQKTMSASVPVAIASDQSAVSVNCVSGCSGGGTSSVAPIQPNTVLNQEVVSATNSAAVLPITAGAGTRIYLYGLAARCSAGTASITVITAGNTVWTSDPNFVGTSTVAVAWTSAPLGTPAGPFGMQITLSSCGAGNVGTLDVQASQL